MLTYSGGLEHPEFPRRVGAMAKVGVGEARGSDAGAGYRTVKFWACCDLAYKARVEEGWFHAIYSHKEDSCRDSGCAECRAAYGREREL